MKKVLGLVMLLFVLSGVAVRAQESAGRDGTPAGESKKADAEVKDENDAYRHSAMVQKIGHMMGMKTETAATTFEVFNFAILAIAIGGFLLKALPKVFRDRNSTIQKHLVDARTATEEATARLNSVEERLSHLDEQIAGLRTQSEKDSAADEARIKATVEEERKKILASADAEIAAATMHAQRTLQQYAADLAIDQAAKKLVVNAETDRLLVQSFARRLGALGSKDGEKLMATNVVFAPKYAHAFASVAASAGLNVAEAQRQMEDFSATLESSPQLRDVMMDPSVPQEQKLAVLDALAERLGMMREVRNFFAVILDHARLGDVREILAAYALVADEGQGVAEAEVTSAHDLNGDDQRELEEQVAKLAGSRVRVAYKQDATLLGGVIVKLGSTVYDGSLRGQLEQMKQTLVAV